MISLPKTVALAAVLFLTISSGTLHAELRSDLESLIVDRGVIAILGPAPSDVDALIAFAKQSEATIYLQTQAADELSSLRAALHAANLLGQRVFTGHGPLDTPPHGSPP